MTKYVFFADKIKASKDGNYFLSDRDSRYKKGSVYCYPCFTKLPKGSIKHVITIVTYGKTLCYHSDKKAISAIKVIFNEICRRIELELTLKSIKDWQN